MTCFKKCTVSVIGFIARCAIAVFLQPLQKLNESCTIKKKNRIQGGRTIRTKKKSSRKRHERIVSLVYLSRKCLNA